MKILIRQRNGLGNQLFQYAAGLYFAQKYNATLEIIRQPPAHAVSFGQARPFLLSKFNISVPVRDRTLVDRLFCATSWYGAPFASFARAVCGVAIWKPHYTTDWVFQPFAPITRDSSRLYLNGFFQAHQFPQRVEQRLRHELVFREPPTGKNLETLQRIRNARSAVSVHIRRGDYTLIYNGRDALPVSYYRNSIQTILNSYPDATFFVFSDDIAFARQNLPRPANLIFVDHNDASTAHEDLRLMAACHHHIIANSTFSWWGAWLNPNPEKLVLAPDRWLDPAVPHPDLIPPIWHRIPAH